MLHYQQNQWLEYHVLRLYYYIFYFTDVFKSISSIILNWIKQNLDKKVYDEK